MRSEGDVRAVCCGGDREYRYPMAHTALLVIDMQRDFLDPRGMCAALGENIAPLGAIVPGVERVLASARAAGLLVIHTREGYAPDLGDVNRLKRERGSAGTPGPLGRFLIRGEPGHDFVPRLRPLPGEPVIDKPGFGAFYRTALEPQLRDRDISHLVLCGVTTQCCVASTLREAVDRGFWCLLLADGCAAIDPAHHDATLAAVRGENHLFGWIGTCAAFCESLRAVPSSR